jgi:Uma2 family endonuclease
MVDWAEITEHWLAVEVLSRSSRVYDRKFKRDAYLALGVPEVWLVDVSGRNLERCRRGSDAELLRDALDWRVPASDVVVRVDLREVFAGVD